MKRFLFLLAGLMFLFSLTKVVPILALEEQSPETIAREHGVTFPIAELGNCTSFSSCQTYCEDPTHYQTCINFAKKKGFYKEGDSHLNDQQFLILARSELGCDSIESCTNYCSKSENFTKCTAFAQKHNISGGPVSDPTEKGFLTKAKQVLGCDSASACAAFCSKQENWKKCSDFAHQMGFRGGEVHAGPGGCTSEETCKAFCSDPKNFQLCANFGSASGAHFTGPGGCNSPESCTSYCNEHPRECGYQGSAGGISNSYFNPKEVCNRTPDCAWTGSTCQCSRMEGVDPQDYCKKYPDRCTGNFGDPAKDCVKYPGCSWSGASCQCNHSTGSNGISPTITPPPTTPCTGPSGGCDSGKYWDPISCSCKSAEDICKQTPGCSWTGTTCNCTPNSPAAGPASSAAASPSSPPATNPPPPSCSQPSGGCASGTYWDSGSCSCKSSNTTSDQVKNMCNQTPGCSWTGPACQCPLVHGAATTNWLEALLQFLQGLFR